MHIPSAQKHAVFKGAMPSSSGNQDSQLAFPALMYSSGAIRNLIIGKRLRSTGKHGRIRLRHANQRDVGGKKGTERLLHQQRKGLKMCVLCVRTCAALQWFGLSSVPRVMKE